MLKTEKRRIEKYLFTNLPEALVPLEVTLRSGKLCIETFRRTKGIAKKFHKLFKKTPFSNEAKAFLNENLSPKVSECGYFCDDINEGHIITYVADFVRDELIQESTVRITSGDGYENLTDYELEKANGEYCLNWHAWMRKIEHWKTFGRKIEPEIY